MPEGSRVESPRPDGDERSRDQHGFAGVLGRAVLNAPLALQRLPMLVRLRVYNGERPAYVAEYALPQPEPRVELCTN